MRVLLLMALASCGASAASAPRPSPAVTAANKTLVFRRLIVGAALSALGIRRFDYVLDTFADTRGDTTRLTVTEYAPTPKFAEWARLDGHELEGTSWTRVKTQTFTGTTSTTEMRLAERGSGTSHLRLACHAHARAVLAPGAKSVDGSCEDRPPEWWLPSATHEVDTYGCEIIDGDEAGLVLELSEAPGIEYVAENSDCTFQNAGYRAVAR